MTNVHILGLDVSMNSTGWAIVVIEDDNTVRLVDSGVIKANTKKPHSFRLRKQRQSFADIVERYRPTYVARESGFSRHIKSTQVLFKAYGVTEEFFDEYDLVEYAASTIKKEVTGDGKADKTEVESAVRYELNIPDSVQFKTDDETDAVAIAFTLIQKKGLLN